MSDKYYSEIYNKMSEEEKKAIKQLMSENGVTDFGKIEHILTLCYTKKPAKVVFFNSSNKNIKSLEGIKGWDFIREIEIFDDNHELQANLEPLCQLKNLEVLTVFNADGRKLEEIKNCINLKRIKITRSVNDISFMQKMKQVEELDLSHNPKLSNISVLENMTKMKKLVLSDTNVSDISVVKNMKELEVLDIQGTKVEDISVLRELSHLKKIFIYDVPIKDLSFLDQLSALEVDVEKAKVGDVSTFEYKRRPEWLYSDIYNQYMNEEEKKAARQLMSENGVTDFGKIEYILGLHNTKPAIVLFSTSSNKNIKSLEGIKDWDFIREVEIWDDDHELQVNLEPLCHLKNLEVFIAENIAERKLEEIENCINLKKIEIARSVKNISFMRKMEQVEELDLSYNSELSDISVLENMTKMKKLVLANTNVSDISILKNMKQLEILDIQSTKVEDISPLRELSHLKKILMHDTPVRDISLLASLPDLEYVDVKKTNVEDVSAFEQAGKLEIFYHYKENYDEETFRAIQQLMKDNGLSLVTDFYKISRIFAWSETIILEGDQAKNIKTLACIKDWDFIKRVIIEGNELRASLEPLCYLKNLERLTVRKFDGERLKAIENCINLKEIWLEETSVKDISFLRKMEQIEVLKLINNPGISDISVVANMKNLKILNISGTQVTDIFPLKGLSHLKSVWMYGTPIKDISVLAELPEIEDINALKTKVEDVSAFIKAGKLKILGIEKSKLPKPVKKDISREISRLKEKITKLKIPFKETISEEELKIFEEKYKIKLPKNYRTFIKEIGNGWKVTQISGEELRSCNSLAECGYDEKGISRRFKYTDSWIWEDDEEATDRKINNALKNGSMSLMELGDGMTYQLIVNGPSAGQIWLFTGEGVTPYRICSDFFDWVNDVLDGNIEM